MITDMQALVSASNPITPVDALARAAAGLRYDDELAWFETTDVEYVEQILRGAKPTIFVFKYTPTGRHLFVDEMGRTHRFERPKDPTKVAGAFRLHDKHADGVDALRPDILRRKRAQEAARWGGSRSTYWGGDWDDDLDEEFDSYGPLGTVCSTACYGDGVRREITQRELRNQSGEIMRALDNGDEFVVTRNGVPVGELLPLRERRFVSTDWLLEQMRGAPSVDYKRLRDDLDAFIDQDPWPRG